MKQGAKVENEVPRRPASHHAYFPARPAARVRRNSGSRVLEAMAAVSLRKNSIRGFGRRLNWRRISPRSLASPAENGVSVQILTERSFFLASGMRSCGSVAALLLRQGELVIIVLPVHGVDADSGGALPISTILPRRFRFRLIAPPARVMALGKAPRSAGIHAGMARWRSFPEALMSPVCPTPPGSPWSLYTSLVGLYPNGAAGTVFRTVRENDGRMECRCGLNILGAFARTRRKRVPAI
jgi:hypothetical protein